MKTLLLPFIICLSILNFTQIVGKYEIESEHSFDTLELKKNGRYEYLSRGDSCWTWSDILGSWEIQNDILILIHEYDYDEDATEYIEVVNEKPDQEIKINVIDNFGKAISNFEVQYTADYDNVQKSITDKNGIAIFKKTDTDYSETDTASIQIKYLENGRESSESAVVQRISDRITISINSNPKTIEKKEKYYFQVLNSGGLKAVKFPYAIENSTYKKL